jgi:SAM-dependent methyltransferase
MARTSLAEIAKGLDTDKKQSPGYIENYERHFGALRDRPVRVLELGVFHGGSLLMWHAYFPAALVVGLDTQPNPLHDMPSGVRFYHGSQGDRQLLERIAAECAPEGFDVIIDDAAHVGDLSRASYQALFQRHLRPGGIYVVEDWGTGYWKSWPDGAELETSIGSDGARTSHQSGMVGFVKELVDEVGYRDAIAPQRGNASLPDRQSLIRSMTIYFGQVFLQRA